VARPKDAGVRVLIIERAARMLRDRESITLRAVVQGTGASTMAVYTHFGGMDGLWRALRQEGFSRLADRLGRLAPTPDPVCDLAALVVAYVQNALEHPDLYRVMFDATVELEDLQAADDTLELLVQAARRGVQAGRFGARTVPLELATQSWAIGHGLVSLVATGPLPVGALALGEPVLAALFTGAGDDPAAARASVAPAWRALPSGT